MKTIVIAGGGAGGLELARALGKKLGKRKKARIVLVDKNRTHIWKPLLHELAAGALDISTDGVDYSAHAKRHHYSFQFGEMHGIDNDAKTIKLAELYNDKNQLILPERQLNYDILVMAVGSVSNDFGTPGVNENCSFLDSQDQAQHFHHDLLDQFMRVHYSPSATQLKIAIVGAGATGVELSAELCHVARLMKVYDLDSAEGKPPELTLLEAGPRILPALPEKTASSAQSELEKLGIKVSTNTRITEANNTGFITAEGDLIQADITVWTAGVKAPDFLKKMTCFELNHIGQIVVKPTLQSSRDDSVYVIGDCCAFKQADGSWVPPRAQSAHQMASTCGKNIIAEINGKPLREFIYTDYGSLINFSSYTTVGNLMGSLAKGSLFIEGHVAKFVYISLYRMHQVAIHGWLGGIVVYLAHKVGNTVKPKMKLH